VVSYKCSVCGGSISIQWIPFFTHIYTCTKCGKKKTVTQQYTETVEREETIDMN
jgi:DNA-directed RNA polymerase subunit RPC12/RpoP